MISWKFGIPSLKVPLWKVRPYSYIASYLHLNFVVVHCFFFPCSNSHFCFEFSFEIIFETFLLSFSEEKKLLQKQLAYILGRLQIFLEIEDDIEDLDELTEIISNSHLNNSFLALGREVWFLVTYDFPFKKSLSSLQFTPPFRI